MNLNEFEPTPGSNSIYPSVNNILILNFHLFFQIIMEKLLLLSMPGAQRLARAYTQTPRRLFVLNTNSIKLVQIRMNSQNKGDKL